MRYDCICGFPHVVTAQINFYHFLGLLRLATRGVALVELSLAI